MFDTDSNGKVTLQELISLVSLKINVHAGHKQIHIGLTAKER